MLEWSCGGSPLSPSKFARGQFARRTQARLRAIAGLPRISKHWTSAGQYGRYRERPRENDLPPDWTILGGAASDYIEGLGKLVQEREGRKKPLREMVGHEALRLYRAAGGKPGVSRPSEGKRIPYGP